MDLIKLNLINMLDGFVVVSHLENMLEINVMYLLNNNLNIYLLINLYLMDHVILDFIPTYKLITDNINDSNMLYQLQLLQFFNIKHFDDSIINNKINNIYLEIKDNDKIIELIQIIDRKFGL